MNSTLPFPFFIPKKPRIPSFQPMIISFQRVIVKIQEGVFQLLSFILSCLNYIIFVLESTVKWFFIFVIVLLGISLCIGLVWYIRERYKPKPLPIVVLTELV